MNIGVFGVVEFEGRFEWEMDSYRDLGSIFCFFRFFLISVFVVVFRDKFRSKVFYIIVLCFFYFIILF